MTVENTTNKQAAQVMGSATYDFTFRCLAKDPTETAAKEAIKCIVADSDGNETTLVYGTDYSVSLDADGIGGTVTVVNSRDSTYTITIMREYQLKQDIVLNDFDEFAAKTLEGSLDKLTMIEQQNQEQLTRSVKVGVTSSVDPDELVQQVERIYQSIDNVDTVADDIANVNDVAESIANVNTLVNNLTNVDTVADNILNVNDVAESIANVDTVANDIANVDTCALNMTAIQAAPAAATAASTSATNAQQYAQDTKGFAPIGSLLPLNCTADYIPDGCLPCDGYEYSSTQFPTLWTNYLTSSPVKLQTCTYAEYATSIATYGSCAKFAVDTTNNTFKVPTIKDGAVIQQALSNTELGKSYNAGLPNITGYSRFNNGDTPCYIGAANTTGAFYENSMQSLNVTQSTTSQRNVAPLGFDASLSNAIYGNSTTVQMNAITARVFVVVANAQINQSQMDWSAWATSLAGKVNTDLSNVNQVGKETVVGWGMPDYTAGVSRSATTYTETTNGFLVVDYTADEGSNFRITINGTSFRFDQGYGGSDFSHCNVGFVPISKGVQYQITDLTGCRVRFFPCIGD